jgi:hypothetical protein
VVHHPDLVVREHGDGHRLEAHLHRGCVAEGPVGRDVIDLELRVRCVDGNQPQAVVGDREGPDLSAL